MCFLEYANHALRELNLTAKIEKEKKKKNSNHYEINVLLIMFKIIYDKANFTPFHKTNTREWYLTRETTASSLIYHEMSFSTLTAVAPWDFTLWCFLFSYFNHSVGKALSCPQHYANIYFGLYYPCVYSKYAEGQMKVSITNVIEFHIIFFLFLVYLQ